MLSASRAMTVRELFEGGELLRAVGAHSALGASLVEEAGFDAVWASSFEISAARCLPDASLLTMTDYLQAAVQMHSACNIPIIADVDTGFGGTMNVAHMVREYEAAGISAVCIEDKLFPKMNSFVPSKQELLSSPDFCRKIEVAKAVQSGPDFFLIARTEALISGQGTSEALRRCRDYANSGADAVLVHSKSKSQREILDFLSDWNGRLPVVVVPTTYPHWHVVDAHEAGVSMVIYANQALRASIQAVRQTLQAIRDKGMSSPVEGDIVPVIDVFQLQRLEEWQELDT